MKPRHEKKEDPSLTALLEALDLFTTVKSACENNQAQARNSRAVQHYTAELAQLVNIITTLPHSEKQFLLKKLDGQKDENIIGIRKLCSDLTNYFSPNKNDKKAEKVIVDLSQIKITLEWIKQKTRLSLKDRILKAVLPRSLAKKINPILKIHDQIDQILTCFTQTQKELTTCIAPDIHSFQIKNQALTKEVQAIVNAIQEKGHSCAKAIKGNDHPSECMEAITEDLSPLTEPVNKKISHFKSALSTAEEELTQKKCAIENCSNSDFIASAILSPILINVNSSVKPLAIKYLNKKTFFTAWKLKRNGIDPSRLDALRYSYEEKIVETALQIEIVNNNLQEIIARKEQCEQMERDVKNALCTKGNIEMTGVASTKSTSVIPKTTQESTSPSDSHLSSKPIYQSDYNINTDSEDVSPSNLILYI